MIDLLKALKPQERNGIVILSEAKNPGLVLPVNARGAPEMIRDVSLRST
jgi:hypothetical protein